MVFDLDELTDHDGTKDCPICRAQQVVEGALVPAASSWEVHHELPRFSLALHGAAVRRGKAAFSSGCKAHPAIAPAGSNRSSHGGDEIAEAFG